ncbi:MAG TPA: diguanylate cyclase [Thermoanaerobaculia bacterium]|nr:diguanylate cyclase [Thermoanaerobaculia bacterium]
MDIQPERLRVTTPAGADPRTAQLETLNEVARIATLDLELRPMLQRITDTLAQKFDWQFVALMTVDRERNAFRCEAVTSTVETSVYVGYGRTLGSGVVGQVAASCEPVLIDDVRTWPNYVETMPGAMSELCVPVKHHGRLVAILNLESTRHGAFHGQLPLLVTVGDQIAGAIACAQLYEELRQRARLMEMMSEVSRTALDATDLRELLDRIVRYIHDHFPLEIAAIVMYESSRREFVQTASAGDIFVAPATRWTIDDGIIGRCIRTRQTQIVPDVAADAEYLKVNARVRSEVVIPIRFRDSLVGVLNLESALPDAFSPANVLAFEAFADQVAGAIHLASMYDRLAETTVQLEQKTRDLEQANAHLANAIETLHRISTQDGLTGVSNRRHFDETIGLEWRRAARSRDPLSLLMLDIDYFKAFNDSVGHQAGDDTLRRVAQTLRSSVHRAADLVARYGGEEFAILLPETDGEHAVKIAEALREQIESLGIDHHEAPLGRVTVSIGVASLIPPRDGSNVEEFVHYADSALYEAKRQGRNRVVA